MCSLSYRHLFPLAAALMLSSLLVFAGNDDKKYAKMIERLDVWGLVDTIPQGDVAGFWNAIWTNSRDLYDMRKAILSGNSAMISAQNRVNNMEKSLESTIGTFGVVNSDTTLSGELSRALAMGQVASTVTIVVLPSDYVNCFVGPDGQMFITRGMVALAGGSRSALVAQCAATFTHYLLWDTLYDAFQLEKKSRGRTVWSTIVGGVASVATDFIPGVGGLAASFTVDAGLLVADNLTYQSQRQALAELQYKYSLDQAVRADIVACRFLRWSGSDPAVYIDWLNELKSFVSDPEMVTRMMFRINLLIYLHNQNVVGSGRKSISKKQLPLPYLTSAQCWAASPSLNNAAKGKSSGGDDIY